MFFADTKAKGGMVAFWCEQVSDCPLVEGHTAPSGRAGTKSVLLGFQFFIPHTTIIGVSIPQSIPYSLSQ